MMFINKTKLFLRSSAFALGAIALITNFSAFAEDKFPSKTIEVITHAGAGGGTDVNSRMMMLRGRRALKTDMVVVNKRGGGGALAMNYFLTRPADGHTIMTFTVGHAITMGKGKTKLKLSDMRPLARGTNDPQILMVNCKTSPYKTSEELKAGTARGDKIKYGGTGVGSIDQLTAFLWAKANGQKLRTYLQFKGGGELATQLVAGSVDVATLNLSEAAAPVEAGDICPLVIMGEARMAPIPKAKTATELGINLVLSTTRGFVTHAGVSDKNAATLEKGLWKAMNHSMYQAYLKNSGLDETSPLKSKAWGKQIERMINQFGPALKEMGIK